MRVSTTDPISGADVKNPEKSPFVIEGEGEGVLKIYFENEDNKNAYLEVQTEHPGKDFTTNLDNPARMAHIFFRRIFSSKFLFAKLAA